MEDIQKLIHRRFKIKKRSDNVVRGARGDRVTLAALWGEVGLNRGVEVGVCRGTFSKILCLNNPNIELYSIDPWFTGGRVGHRRERHMRRAIKKLAPFAVTIIRKTSMEALADFEDGSLDFAFIDGNHTFDYVAPDIIFWSKKVRSGGMIGVHDYHRHRWGGVIEAVNAYTFCHNINPWYVTWEATPTAFWVKP